MKDLCSKYDALAKELERFQQQSTIQHDTLMRALNVFRAEMRSEFSALKAIKTQNDQSSICGFLFR